MPDDLFCLDGEGALRWDNPTDRTEDLTIEQAQVIALAKAASALGYIGDALYQIVDAIKELRRD
jgi:hypothetical protein